MKDITEFKAWFSNEISQYPLIAKSNPLSLNELCYVLRQSGRDFSVGWLTDTGYGTVPSNPTIAAMTHFWATSGLM